MKPTLYRSDLQTRKQRRNEAHMSEADRRQRMRGVFRAVAHLATEMQDTTRP